MLPKLGVALMGGEPLVMLVPAFSGDLPRVIDAERFEKSGRKPRVHDVVGVMADDGWLLGTDGAYPSLEPVNLAVELRRKRERPGLQVWGNPLPESAPEFALLLEPIDHPSCNERLELQREPRSQMDGNPRVYPGALKFGATAPN